MNKIRCPTLTSSESRLNGAAMAKESYVFIKLGFSRPRFPGSSRGRVAALAIATTPKIDKTVSLSIEEYDMADECESLINLMMIDVINIPQT
ncbi:hypothetical protein VTP01DRAFT_10624 [Rhizomucor pusillus]|uniref:uncharacterized protein n=1 Tax=Rhizomucor pusillus TaxID=4840 RepID=UPI00374362A6